MSEEDESNFKKVLEFSSEKVNCLIEIFRSSIIAQKFHAIVFVERKYSAYYLDQILQKLCKMEEFAFIKSDFVFGNSRQNIKEIMNNTKQAFVLQKFRKHEINILVSTNIVEEGVDIPACNMIIRFSKIHNFGSYIQSKGRARSDNSSYYILVDEEQSKDYDKDIVNFLEIEQDIESKLVNKEINMDDDEEEMAIDEAESAASTQFEDEIRSLNGIIRSYKKGSSEITCHTAINLINRYCTSLEHNVCGVLYPIYSIETSADTIAATAADDNGNSKSFQCSVRLPPNSVLNKTIKSDWFARKKWAKMHAALKMCVELDKSGELADNLTVLSKEEWIAPHYNIKEDEDENLKSELISISVTIKLSARTNSRAIRGDF
jgi:endoribonuclease Dicer